MEHANRTRINLTNRRQLLVRLCRPADRDALVALGATHPDADDSFAEGLTVVVQRGRRIIAAARCTCTGRRGCVEAFVAPHQRRMATIRLALLQRCAAHLCHAGIRTCVFRNLPSRTG